MRVVFVGLSGRDYPFVRVRCYDFARELSLRGIPSSVISFRDHLSGGLSEVEMWDRGDREKLRMNLRALARLVREPGSVLYIQKIHYNAAAPFLLARAGMNRFILDYDDWDHGIHCIFKRPWLNRLVWGHADYVGILREVAGRARCCVVASGLLLDRLSAYNPRVFLIPTGVDTARFAAPPRPARDRVVFGWNGVVWGEIMFENMRFMLDGFARVAADNPAVALRLVGAGQWWGRVQELVRERYASLDISLGDWVPFERMPSFLASLDAGLLPLIQKDDPWVDSKSPTKYFEYLASGLPTVASPTAELRRFVADGEHGFLAADADSFAAKMALLARDPALRERMGESARTLAGERFSIGALGEKLAGVVREVCG